MHPSFPPAPLLPRSAPMESPRESWDIVEVSPLIDVRDIGTAIRRRLPWLIALPVVFVALALVYLFVIATPLYESKALVFVDPEFDAILQIEHVQSAAPDLDSLNSLEKAITSDSMILRVIDKLNLRNEPDFLPSSLRKMQAKGETISDTRLLKEISGKRISASLIRPTRLIELTVYDPNAERAQLIANTIVTEFETFLGEQKRTEAGNSEKDLRRQADEAYTRALDAEKQLEKFRQANPDLTVEQDHQLFADRLSRVGEELNFATGKVLEMESRVKTLESIDPKTDPVKVIEVGKFSELKQVSDILAQRAGAKASLAAIATRYRPVHQRYQEAEAQVTDVEEQLRQLARDLKESLSASLESARANEIALAARVKELQGELTEVKSLSSQFRAVQQKVETEWLVHQNLQAKIGETSLSTEKSTAITTLMSEPMVAYKASKPNKPITVLASGFLGALFGLGLVGADLLRGGPFAGRRQAEEFLHAEAVAQIPERSDNSEGESKLLSEMTKILLSPEHRQSRLIHVTAVSECPDGLRTAASLASASALYSCPTLLVSVLPPRQSNDLVTLTPRPSRTENLYTMVLTSEFLLAPEDAWQLLGPHCREFNRIIVESTATPQESKVPEVLASFAETNLLIVSMQRDSRTDVRNVKTALTRHSNHPLSLVLQG